MRTNSAESQEFPRKKSVSGAFRGMSKFFADVGKNQKETINIMRTKQISAEQFRNRRRAERKRSTAQAATDVSKGGENA